MQQLPFYDINADNSFIEAPSTLNSENISEGLKDLKFDQLRDKGLKCLQFNIVSLTKNIDELRSILLNNDVHVCALNETRLDKDIDNSEINVHGYTIVRKDRNRNGGGVAIYVQNDIKYTVIEDDSMHNLESIII